MAQCCDSSHKALGPGIFFLARQATTGDTGGMQRFAPFVCNASTFVHTVCAVAELRGFSAKLVHLTGVSTVAVGGAHVTLDCISRNLQQ